MSNIAQNDGSALLDGLSAFIRRFVVMNRAQADVCALWIVHTFAIEAADFTPYLHIYSPVLRSGKTRLLEVLRMLAHKPWFTGRVTGSALVRKTDKDHPSLLLDESDAALQSKGDYPEALRGILNSGFEKDGIYSICVQNGKEWEPRDFSTFSPKAIAGIGRLPCTVEDRAIPIQLKRKLRHEQGGRFRKKKVKPESDQLRERCIRWANENLEALRIAEPSGHSSRRFR